MPPEPDTHLQPRTDIRNLLIAGGVVIGVTVAAIVGWGFFAKLNSAALANGVVATHTGRKLIQHLEGGIVRQIAVREGDRVRQGQLLVELDPTKARASHDILRTRYLTALATRARLHAERDGATDLVLNSELETPAAAPALAEQRHSLTARRTAFESKIALLDQRASRTAREIRGMRAQLNAIREQSELVEKQLANLTPLIEKGFVRNNQVLSLKVRKADLLGESGKLEADIARAEQRIEEVAVEKAQARAEREQRISDELKNTDSEIADALERLRAATDVLRRVRGEAPQSGIVTGLRVATIGGVIPPGETILEIVPDGDARIIEAYIKPDDIDVVRPGLPVNVRLTAISRRSSDPLTGVVQTVSPDRITEGQGEGFFRATVKITSDASADSLGFELQSGMTAELEIVIGERRAYEYLFSPVTDSMGRAFREQ